MNCGRSDRPESPDLTWTSPGHGGVHGQRCRAEPPCQRVHVLTRPAGRQTESDRRTRQRTGSGSAISLRISETGAAPSLWIATDLLHQRRRRYHGNSRVLPNVSLKVSMTTTALLTASQEGAPSEPLLQERAGSRRRAASWTCLQRE